MTCIICLGSQPILRNKCSFFRNCVCNENYFHYKCWREYSQKFSVCPICKSYRKTFEELITTYFESFRLQITVCILCPLPFLLIGMKELSKTDLTMFGYCCGIYAISILTVLELWHESREQNFSRFVILYFFLILFLIFFSHELVFLRQINPWLLSAAICYFIFIYYFLFYYYWLYFEF